METNTLNYSVEELGIDQSRYCFVPANAHLQEIRKQRSILILSGFILIIILLIVLSRIPYLFQDKPATMAMLFIILFAVVIGLAIIAFNSLFDPEKADYIQHYGLVRSQYRLFIKDKKLGVCKRNKIILPAEYDRIEIQGVSQITVWKDDKEKVLFFPNGFRFSLPKGTSFEKDAESLKERKEDIDRTQRNPLYIILYIIVFMMAFGLCATLFG